MSHAPAPWVEAFGAAAEKVAKARPEVDPEVARELMLEAATMLYDGLALDGLDEHDTDAVVAGLCTALVAEDPGGAVRDCSTAALEAPGDLHEPASVAAAYLAAAAVLRL